MGEFLSAPIKDKFSDDNEGSTVNIYNNTSFVTQVVECKAGEKEWRILIYLILM